MLFGATDDLARSGGPGMIAPLPAIPVESSQWHQALYAFLVEKGNR